MKVHISRKKRATHIEWNWRPTYTLSSIPSSCLIFFILSVSIIATINTLMVRYRTSSIMNTWLNRTENVHKKIDNNANKPHRTGGKVRPFLATDTRFCWRNKAIFKSHSLFGCFTERGQHRNWHEKIFCFFRSHSLSLSALLNGSMMNKNYHEKHMIYGLKLEMLHITSIWIPKHTKKQKKKKIFARNRTLASIKC